jgi:hypothetical protein
MAGTTGKRLVGDYLAEHWADKEMAILDDGTTWGAGVANGVRHRLRERGVRVAVDETIAVMIALGTISSVRSPTRNGQGRGRPEL